MRPVLVAGGQALGIVARAQRHRGAAAQRDGALATDHNQSLAMVSLRYLAEQHKRIDLLHLDVQGGEYEMIAESLDVLREKIAYVVIGTHLRAIEGRLWQALEEAGWLLAMERPGLFTNHEINSPFRRVECKAGAISLFSPH